MNEYRGKVNAPEFPAHLAWLNTERPLTMAGLRLAMGRAVKGMINGEMFIAIVGLGKVVTSSGNRFDAEGVLAVLILIIGVALVAVKVVQLVDQRLTSWLPSTSRQRRRNA